MSKQSLFRNAEPSARPCFPPGASLGSLQTQAGVPPTPGNGGSRRERAAGRRGGAGGPGLQSVSMATAGPLPARTLPTPRPSHWRITAAPDPHVPRSKGSVLVCRLPERRIRVLRAGPPRSRRRQCVYF